MIIAIVIAVTALVPDRGEGGAPRGAGQAASRPTNRHRRLPCCRRTLLHPANLSARGATGRGEDSCRAPLPSRRCPRLIQSDALSLLSEALNFDFARKGMDEAFTDERDGANLGAAGDSRHRRAHQWEKESDGARLHSFQRARPGA
jgi:hypothetical protein